MSTLEDLVRALDVDPWGKLGAYFQQQPEALLLDLAAQHLELKRTGWLGANNVRNYAAYVRSILESGKPPWLGGYRPQHGKTAPAQTTSTERRQVHFDDLRALWLKRYPRDPRRVGEGVRTALLTSERHPWAWPFVEFHGMTDEDEWWLQSCLESDYGETSDPASLRLLHGRADVIGDHVADDAARANRYSQAFEQLRWRRRAKA